MSSSTPTQEPSTITASPHQAGSVPSPVPPLLWATGLSLLWAIFADGVAQFPYLEEEWADSFNLSRAAAIPFVIPGLALGQLLLASRHHYRLARVVGTVAQAVTVLVGLRTLLIAMRPMPFWVFTLLLAGPPIVVCLEGIGWHRSTPHRQRQSGDVATNLRRRLVVTGVIIAGGVGLARGLLAVGGGYYYPPPGASHTVGQRSLSWLHSIALSINCSCDRLDRTAVSSSVYREQLHSLQRAWSNGIRAHVKFYDIDRSIHNRGVDEHTARWHDDLGTGLDIGMMRIMHTFRQTWTFTAPKKDIARLQSRGAPAHFMPEDCLMEFRGSRPENDSPENWVGTSIDLYGCSHPDYGSEIDPRTVWWSYSGT